MKLEENYRLSQYQDLGKLDGRENIRLKRHKIYGYICVEKYVSPEAAHIYEFLKDNPSSYFPVIYECVRQHDRVIIIEEYIDGRNIEEMLREKLFYEERAVEIILEICKALKIFHHARPQRVHRDIKAENVMITNSGSVKIIDFDIAREVKSRQSRDTQLLGTQEYAAPEQYGLGQTDERSDIYSVGVLLNYMLLKKFPYQKTFKGTVSSVIEKCMKLDPKDRYQSVEELIEHLKELYPQYDDGEVTWEESREKRLLSWIPPGFRSRTPWKMVVAVLGYLCIAWLCFSMEITKEDKVVGGIVAVSEQVIVWVSQMVYVALVWDYRGCKRYFKVLRHRNKIIRIIIYVGLWILLLFIAAFFCVLKDMLLA